MLAVLIGGPTNPGLNGSWVTQVVAVALVVGCVVLGMWLKGRRERRQQRGRRGPP